MLRHRSTLPLVSVLLVGLLSTAGTPAAPKDEAMKLREARAKAYAHLMRSTVTARRGDLKKAAEEIHAATKLQPNSAAVHAQAAEMLLLLGRANQAEAAALRAQELEPDHPQTLRFLADRATDRARRAERDDVATHQAALDLLVRIEQLGYADADVLHAIRAIRLRLGDTAGALDAARELVERRPGDKRAVSQFVGLLLEESLETEALEVVLRFIAKHPNDTELLGFAQELATKLDSWNRIDEVFSAEPGLARSNTVAQRLWAVALLELDDRQRATAAFERALVAQPDDPALRYDAARVYRESGRLADAAALLHDLAAEEPSDRRVLLMLGETLADQGVIDGAQNAFVAALRMFSAEGETASMPIRDAIRRRMVLLYLANDQLSPARHMCEQLEDIASPEAHELQVRVAIAAEDWGTAREGIKSVREGSEPGRAALLDGELLLRTGKMNKARVRYQEAIDSLGPLSQVQIAETYLELEQLEPGESLLRAWVDRDRMNPDVHYYLGSFLFRAEGLGRAEPALRRVIELDPAHAPALNFLGYSLAEAGVKLDEALSLIERALSIDPWNGAYLDSLGWVYFRLERFRDSRGPLESAAREFPSDAVVLDHLGDLYERLGESELALTAWGQALDNAPADPAKIEAKIALLAEPPGAGLERR